MLKVICADEKLRPELGTAGSAGFDLRLASDVHINIGRSQKVGTGVKVEIPKGYVGIVAPRSSTGGKGLVLTNTIGWIDSDYQGEIFLSIKNVGTEAFLGYKYDKLFQLVIVPILTPKLVFVKEFDTITDRGERGFGSTGE